MSFFKQWLKRFHLHLMKNIPFLHLSFQVANSSRLSCLAIQVPWPINRSSYFIQKIHLKIIQTCFLTHFLFCKFLSFKEVRISNCKILQVLTKGVIQTSSKHHLEVVWNFKSSQYKSRVSLLKKPSPNSINCNFEP